MYDARQITWLSRFERRKAVNAAVNYTICWLKKTNKQKKTSADWWCQKMHVSLFKNNNVFCSLYLAVESVKTLVQCRLCWVMEKKKRGVSKLRIHWFDCFANLFAVWKRHLLVKMVSLQWENSPNIVVGSIKCTTKQRHKGSKEGEFAVITLVQVNSFSDVYVVIFSLCNHFLYLPWLLYTCLVCVVVGACLSLVHAIQNIMCHSDEFITLAQSNFICLILCCSSAQNWSDLMY